jgi:hypothetical protein
MSGLIHHLRRAVFGAVVLGSLGLGATQALASPAAPEPEAVCTVKCMRYCAMLGLAGGTCSAGGGCSCFDVGA